MQLNMFYLYWLLSFWLFRLFFFIFLCKVLFIPTFVILWTFWFVFFLKRLKSWNIFSCFCHSSFCFFCHSRHSFLDKPLYIYIFLHDFHKHDSQKYFIYTAFLSTNTSYSSTIIICCISLSIIIILIILLQYSIRLCILENIKLILVLLIVALGFLEVSSIVLLVIGNVYCSGQSSLSPLTSFNYCKIKN